MDFKTPGFSDLMKWYCLTFRIEWDAWWIYKYLCLANGGLHLFNKIGWFLVILKVKIQGNGLSLRSTTSEQELEFVNSWTQYHRGNRDLEGSCTHRMNSTTKSGQGNRLTIKKLDPTGWWLQPAPHMERSGSTNLDPSCSAVDQRQNSRPWVGYQHSSSP